MENRSTTFVMIPETEWNELKATLSTILKKLSEGLNLDSHRNVITPSYLTATEFMAAVKVKRTKFDQMVRTNKIKIIKKKRKIYVPVCEIERYFKDPTV